MDFLRQVLRGGFRVLGHVYSYKLHLKLVGFRDALYTLWIRNFLGETGAASSFHYPISLQGGGSRHIHVGARTSIESHGILGCWETFGKDQHYEPEIIIGEDCNIGEYCHITAVTMPMEGCRWRKPPYRPYSVRCNRKVRLSSEITYGLVTR